MDPIHIGETVGVDGRTGTWTGEVLDFIVETGEPPTARVRCIRPPASVSDRDAFGIRAGDGLDVLVGQLTRVGDPEGMREDGCDDVDVTGRVRPYHRHAVTGAAHAHPGGGLAHTHQVGPHAAGMVRQEYVQQEPPPDRPVPDPVEVVAWIIRDHRHGQTTDWVGPVGNDLMPNDDDRVVARRVLAALVAGPWHLVTLEPGWLPIGVPAVAEVWEP